MTGECTECGSNTLRAELTGTFCYTIVCDGCGDIKRTTVALKRLEEPD